MKKHRITHTALIALLLLFLSCKKDKDLVPLPPPVVNAPEVITSLIVHFTDSSGITEPKAYTFRDPDGPGGKAATEFDTIKLGINKTYFVTMIMLDETKSPIDTISNEVAKEKDDHQFFFTHTGVNINTVYLDKDSKGLPVGLATKWTTGAISSGTSKVVLKHQAGTKDGTSGTGDTDVEVIFESLIK